jgi:hypothetical protein
VWDWIPEIVQSMGGFNGSSNHFVIEETLAGSLLIAGKASHSSESEIAV